MLSCNAKREEAEGQLRAAAVAESKLKRDLLVLKDDKKAMVARMSQLEGDMADALAALAAARADGTDVKAAQDAAEALVLAADAGVQPAAAARLKLQAHQQINSGTTAG